MHSVVKAYENTTQKERHKGSLDFELCSWKYMKIVWQRDTTDVLK